MASLGKIEKFDPKNTNIDYYLDRLEQYFVAIEIGADSSTSHRRRAILISVIGGKVYDVLADLCSPASPSSRSCAELKAISREQFALKRLLSPKDTVFTPSYKRKAPVFPNLPLNLSGWLLHATLAPICPRPYEIGLCVLFEAELFKNGC